MRRPAPDIIDEVAAKAGIAPEAAEAAVDALLATMAARLPSPVFARVRSVLDDEAADPAGLTGPADGRSYGGARRRP